METQTSRSLITMKSLRTALAVLFAIFIGYASPANATPEEVQQRAQTDLNGKCLELFLSNESPGLLKRSSFFGYQFFADSLLGNAVFVFGGTNSQQYCTFATKGAFLTWEDAEKSAIAACEKKRFQGGTPCVVYARNNNIVYVSPHEKAKVVANLYEASDPAANQNINKVGKKDSTALTPTERTDNELGVGSVASLAPKTDPDSALALRPSSDAWSKYQGMVAEQNALQAKKQKEQAEIEALQAKREAEQHAKQERLDAIKAEREERQREEIRRAEAKRIAIEGDGSADDITCKSFGARPGSDGYINCRVQLSRTKQLADEQQAAQKASEVTAEKARNLANFHGAKKCADETKNPTCINNAGTYALRLGNMGDARDWWTLAARYGDPVAIKNLTNNGFPIPEPDLLRGQEQARNNLVRQQEQAKNSDNAAAALLLLLGGVNAYQQGKAAGHRSTPTPAPARVDCTTDVVGSTAYTRCR